ncbi:MAG: hypothetical protein CSA76_02155 [Spirochaetales bacterium]|nr:MAG: hypothetical protein CSA76_02155 [Spirochaetales bacterium]
MAALWWQDVQRLQLSALEGWEAVLDKLEKELSADNGARNTGKWAVLLRQASEASLMLRRGMRLADSREQDARRSGIPEKELLAEIHDAGWHSRVRAAVEKSSRLSRRIREQMDSVSSELARFSASQSRQTRRSVLHAPQPSHIDLQV